MEDNIRRCIMITSLGDIWLAIIGYDDMILFAMALIASRDGNVVCWYSARQLSATILTLISLVIFPSSNAFNIDFLAGTSPGTRGQADVSNGIDFPAGAADTIEGDPDANSVCKESVVSSVKLFE